MSNADSNWLAALQTCIADGGTLAKPETAAENTEIQTLLGEKNKIIMWEKNLDWFLKNNFKYVSCNNLFMTSAFVIV